MKTEKTYKLVKMLCPCMLADKAVYKYVNGNTGEIKITVENYKTGKIYGFHIFSSEEALRNWLDKITKEEDWYYNRVQVTYDVINVIGE